VQDIIQPAGRIASIKPYFFASLNQTIEQLRGKGIDIIRLDMGSPDLPPADFIIESLVQTARQPNSHGYSAPGGTIAFRQAVAEYYLRRFQIRLDPHNEILALIGSKEGVFNFIQAFTNPGDINLIPDPGYPAYQVGTKISGGEIYSLPLLKENDFLPDLDAVPESITEKAKILWLNYPNNPTGAVAPKLFLEKAVQFARDRKILLAHDAPYMDICYDSYRASSILQIPGAKDVSVEFNSLSKTYNMAGWRLGMAVGNSKALRILKTYKSQVDSSSFNAIYNAGITALTGDQSWLEKRNNTYQGRRDLIVSRLIEAGFTITPPAAAIYIWAQMPDGDTDDMAFVSNLLQETGVSIAPGSIYGEHGRGYLRFSLGATTEDINKAMQRIIKWRNK
jgi:LL-diaminopimelate aminotransferase